MNPDRDLPQDQTAQDSSSLLVIGEAHTGKSHYGAQLLRRLQVKASTLRLLDNADDLTQFAEVCACLAEGKSAPHTPSGVYRESIWNIESSDGKHRSRLIWPDYAGEQIEQITRLRRIAEPWVARVRQSSGWLLFIRLGLLLSPEDVLSRPRAKEQMRAAHAPSGVAPVPPPTSAAAPGGESVSLDDADGQGASAASDDPGVRSYQARVVELLQALLFARQISTNAPIVRPALLVALSCFDESIGTTSIVSSATTDGGVDDSPAIAGDDAASHGRSAAQDPVTALAERLPLVSAFIHSNWSSDTVGIIGVSALGKALSPDVADEEFMDNGPEEQGWCTLQGGSRTADLTVPISILMDMATRK